ncbi:MAG TPA: hypothetical protein VGK74_05620 [Symbiobacteriaceae bacterium]|jgi:hypothetical protein
MTPFSQREFLDLQEHIRGEAATVQTCRQFARVASDPDLKAFCEETARTAEANVNRLMTHVRQGITH